MKKRILIWSCALLVIISSYFAWAETITLTTYYPAPYGVYREMRSQRMAIGDNYYQGSNYYWPGEGSGGTEIDANADLIVEGNVGIGTTSPAYLTDIRGTTNARSYFHVGKGDRGLYYAHHSDGNIGLLHDCAYNDSGTSIAKAAKINQLQFYDGSFYFYTATGQTPGSAASFGDAKVIIKNTGNVGIGTTSPEVLFHVYKATHNHLLVDSGGTDQNAAFQSHDGTYSVYSGLMAGSGGGVGNWVVYTGGGGVVLTATQTGNVGIGRTPTTNDLEVEGTASKTASGDWLTNSDIRIKTDIGDIENALEVINQLRPVRFHYKDEYKTEHPSLKDTYYYNFIAQEFQEVFPDSVEEDGEGYLQIDTHNVKPYLVAAVQELNKTVDGLKSENNALKERVLALEARLR